MMQAQFGQFQSFSATQLLDQEVVKEIKVNDKEIKSIVDKCKYLFYEIKETETNEGGYKIELSFEDNRNIFCDVDAVKDMIMQSDQVQFGKSKQSILQTLFITNQQLLEMRRLMTTKCSVNLNGSIFNIFKLVKLINQMKSQNQLAKKV